MNTTNDRTRNPASVPGLSDGFAKPQGALTQPLHYRDPANFLRERQAVFGRTWSFAGMANEIGNANDYVRANVAGVDVILQNCGGRLRAFVNSCSHRHSRIHELPCGNRKLICPYHGWTYDDEGIPTGIPARANFPQVCANPEQFALRQLEVARVGDFVFSRLEQSGPGLQEFLGEAWDFLSNASAGLEAKMDDFRGTVGANWKVVIENALEGYHVPLVHRDTLAAINQFSMREDAIVDHLPAGRGHSSMTNLADAVWLQRWRRFEPSLGVWPFKFDHYVHHHIFPNLTVTSFMGYSFHIQVFQPVAVDRTDVHSRIYSVKCEGRTEAGARIMRSVYEEGQRFTRKVFAEDQQACALTQQGLQDAERPAVLASNLEKRIAHFQRFYMQVMAGTTS